MEGDSKGDFREDFKQDMERGLFVKLRSGPGQVWVRLQLKFNSLELDSEVGRLVCFLFQHFKLRVTNTSSSLFELLFNNVCHNNFHQAREMKVLLIL